MEYIHVKNLEKHHPGYKDRQLQWCKLHFSTLTADAEFSVLPETDKWRFFAFVMLELQNKRPIPVDELFLTRNGFNLKARPISLTLKMLHNFLDVLQSPVHNFSDTVLREDKIREEKSRLESVTEKTPGIPVNIEPVKLFFKNDLMAQDFWDYYASNGWKVGNKAPMRDWTAAARRWQRNNAPRAQKVAKETLQKCFVCEKDVLSDLFMVHIQQHKLERNNEQNPKLMDLVSEVSKKRGAA